MARKTFSAPLKIVGTAGTDAVLETATSGDSSSGAGTVVMEASGDLKSQNVGGMKVALGPWIATNLATAQTLLAVNAGGVATSPEIGVPYAGSVLAIAVCFQTRMTAGAFDAWATKNGTTIATLKVSATTIAGALVFTTSQNKDVTTLAAGDRIGVKVTTSAAYAPNTADPSVVVVVDQ